MTWNMFLWHSPVKTFFSDWIRVFDKKRTGQQKNNLKNISKYTTPVPNPGCFWCQIRVYAEIKTLFQVLQVLQVNDLDILYPAALLETNIFLFFIGLTCRDYVNKSLYWRIFNAIKTCFTSFRRIKKKTLCSG